MFSPEMAAGLIEATGQFERDPDVRCVVIRGAGEHFQSGGDVKALHRSLTENREKHLAGTEHELSMDTWPSIESVACGSLFLQLFRGPLQALV